MLSEEIIAAIWVVQSVKGYNILQRINKSKEK